MMAIAGLRRRLRHPDTREHPDVKLELRKLELDLVNQAEEGGGPPGRHRYPGRRSRGRPGEPDLVSQRPDPAAAATPPEFMQLLRQFRAWHGDPTFRAIAARSGQARVHSTICTALHGDTLPARETVRAIVTGCGGTAEDVRAFDDAWNRISHPTSGPVRGGSFHAAPVTAA
jgi:hypothetical protein